MENYTELYTKITYIYGLYNLNEPDIIRYVGKANNPIARKNRHISDSKRENTYKSNWIKSFDAKKYLRLKILAICPDKDFPFYEENFIKKYQSDKLINSDETGQVNIGRKREIIDKAVSKISKIVYQFDLNGNFLAEYKSAREAARHLKVSHSYISRNCNGEFKHTQGFIFSYDKNKSINKVENPNAIKKNIIEVDSNNNIINEWISIMECSRDTKIDNGNLSRVCNGKRNNIKGRFFRFK
jgi:hypothetical protein